jgi:hypothetical protein
MKLNGVRKLLVVFAAVLAGVSSARAQQSEPAPASVERIRTALQAPQQPINSNGMPIFAPSKPDQFHWGILTFLAPDTPGQFVSIRVPVGDLVSRTVHSIAATQHRRAENAAHAEVVKALADFQHAQPK